MGKYTKWHDPEREESLKKAVASSTSIAGAARILGLAGRGGNIATIRHHITRLNLDTSHHTGPAWNRGKYANPSTRSTSDTWKSYLLRTYGYACWNCKLSEWQELPIPLELDHINGNNSDNWLENLRILCSNCHAQTPTFKNKKRPSPAGETANALVPKTSLETVLGSTPRQGTSFMPAAQFKCVICKKVCSKEKYWHDSCNRCVDCGKRTTNLRCRNCDPLITVLNWPELDELASLVKINGFSEAARILDCSDNSIRKYLRKFGINTRDLTPFNNGRGRQ